MSRNRDFPLTHMAESGRIPTRVAQSVSHLPCKVFIGTQRRRWGMGKRHGDAPVVEASRLLDGFRLGGAKQIARQVLASKRREDSIGDPLRKHIGPLIDRLVGDADCVCGGRHGSAEEFDGLGLEHDSLNHSSGRSATIVQAAPCNFPTMVELEEFKERLAWAMREAKMSVSDAAKPVDEGGFGMSYQAVKKLLDGTSKSMSSTNLIPAARRLKVDPSWLAVGEGEPRPQPITSGALSPMEAAHMTLYRMLPPQKQHEIDSEMNTKVAEVAPAPSAANPFGKAPRPSLATKAAEGGSVRNDLSKQSKAKSNKEKAKVTK